MWEAARLRWEIQELRNNQTVALMNQTSDYPLGLHPWYFPDDSCHDPGSPLRSLLLQQAVEVPGKFCCDYGACIDSRLVCDQNQHCDDLSDEAEELCQTVERGQHYRTNKPPRTSSKQEGRWRSVNPSILVDVAIEYLMDLNEEEASMTLLFNTRLAWKDFRCSRWPFSDSRIGRKGKRLTS